MKKVYVYFVSFKAYEKHGLEDIFGNGDISIDTPLDSLEKIQEVEQHFAKKVSMRAVTVLWFQLLRIEKK